MNLLATNVLATIAQTTDAPIQTPDIAWRALGPVLALITGAVVLLASSALLRKKPPSGFYALGTVITAVVSMAFAVPLWREVTDPERGPFSAVKGAISVDGFAVFFVFVIGAAVVLAALLCDGYLRRERLDGVELYVLMLLSASGGVIMATANDLIVMFLGLEILSIAVYVLAAMHLRRIESQEAGVKYFVLGAFSSAFFLYGIALVYGSTGSTNLARVSAGIVQPLGSSVHPEDLLSSHPPALLLAGFALLLVGFGFKIAAVPFHSWTPDVYQGSPTPIVSFMASGVKAAAFAGLLRVFLVAFEPFSADWQPYVYVLAVATMLVGSVLAVVQTDIKRMLAYSSINHAGFILIGVQAASSEGISSALFYLAAYTFMVVGSFGVVTVLTRKGDTGTTVEDYKGLSAREPVLAFVFAIFLFAQAGVPLTSGFFAKFYVLRAAIEANSWPLAIVAMLSAVIAAFLYLRIVVAMFMSTDEAEEGEEGEEAAPAPAPRGPRVAVPFAAKLALGVAFAFTVAVGFLPSSLADASTDATPTVTAPPKWRETRCRAVTPLGHTEGMGFGGLHSRALWRVRPYLAPYKTHITVVMVTSVISSIGMVAVPLIVKTVIDGPLAEGDRAGVVRWSLFAAGIALVEVFLAYTRRYLLVLVATGLETSVRNDLYAQLQRLDVGFHDRWQSGQLLSRAMTDLSVMRRFVGFGVVFFFLITVQVLGIFAVLLALHVPLALLTFMFAIPVLVLCHRFQQRYQRIVRVIQDRTGDLTTTIEEGAKGIRVLKAFGRGNEAFAGYQAQAREIYGIQMERIKLHTRFVWVIGIIPNLTLTVVLLAGVLAVGNGSLTLGGLVAFVAYVLMLTFPLEVLAWIMAMAGEAETAAARIYEVFDTEPLVTDRPGAIALPEDALGEIRFEGVSFTYEGSDRTVLEGIDLTVAPGEAIAVVGATGSGKTTLVTLLTRLYDPTVGRITFDGHDLRDLTVTSLRRHVGFAFEEPSLFSASVRENLLMGKPDATEAEVLQALEVAQADFALDLPWGLDTRIGEQGLSLSGGQRQRLALARAIIGRPRVLVLDDPLSAVDVHTEAAAQEALRPLLEGCTVFIVVHRPSTIALANRSILLDGGRLVASGSHHDLLDSEPRYRAVLSEDAEEVETV